MPMQLKWQHCAPFSPAPSPGQAQACWQNALSHQHRVKVLLELLKQELWNVFNPRNHLGFFFSFCRQPRGRLGSHGWEAEAGGKGKNREGGRTLVSIPKSAMASSVPINRQYGERHGAGLFHITTLSQPEKGDNSGHVEKRFQKQVIVNLVFGVSKAWRPSKSPPTQPDLNCTKFQI